MDRLVIGLGGFFVVLGLLILVFPDWLVSTVNWESRQGQYLAAGMRVVIGLVLLLSASSTRYPKVLRTFGGLILVAGLALLFIPIDAWSGLIRWWLVENVVLYRVGGGLVGMLLGAFFVYAAQPERRAA